MSTGSIGLKYRSIFLDKDWAHQKYYGWNTVIEQPGLTILNKRRGIFERNLILLRTDGKSELANWMADATGRSLMNDIIIHDFDGIYTEAPTISTHIFHKAVQSERLLNIATFVIDLKRDETEILKAMSSDSRRKTRKAEAAGIVVEAHSSPSNYLTDKFLHAFNNFATKRGLNPADASVIKRMYTNGNAVLFIARKGEELINYLHVYTAGNTGSFMYGVNLSKVNDGAGQYLHWQAMKWLKASGYAWYDLGGVASIDSTDGIFNFKRKFGGDLVDLGIQWRSSGALFRFFSTTVSVLKWIRKRRLVRVTQRVNSCCK